MTRSQILTTFRDVVAGFAGGAPVVINDLSEAKRREMEEALRGPGLVLAVGPMLGSKVGDQIGPRLVEQIGLVVAIRVNPDRYAGDVYALHEAVLDGVVASPLLPRIQAGYEGEIVELVPQDVGNLTHTLSFTLPHVH